MKRLLVMAIIAACLSITIGALAQKIGGGDLTFTPKVASPVVFSHEKHVVDKELKCVGCHYQIFQMAQGPTRWTWQRAPREIFAANATMGKNRST